eukprot:TRINITY_DN5043_c0_g1_i1.p1 TRINITY_DN5043_c0_g1~~TRINITY_DN5043_c0_g1_i1.p1  ORF type:complete len:529 (-),score=132.41 TRINITY_DN5043_c0_g1_i1:348-1853(-)
MATAAAAQQEQQGWKPGSRLMRKAARGRAGGGDEEGRAAASHSSRLAEYAVVDVLMDDDDRPGHAAGKDAAMRDVAPRSAAWLPSWMLFGRGGVARRAPADAADSEYFAAPEVSTSLLDGDASTTSFEEAALGQGDDTERVLLALAAVILSVFFAVVCLSKMIRTCFSYVVARLWDPKPVKKIHVAGPTAPAVADTKGGTAAPAIASHKKRRKVSMHSGGSSSPTRTQVEALERILAEDVKLELPVACSYDCALSKPLRSRRTIRLEGEVVEAVGLGSKPLVAPLSEQECVLYSATVSKRVRGQGLAVSFAAANVDFKLRLLDDPSTTVEVMGMDVSVFDMCEGRLVRAAATFQSVPKHWRAFVVKHQVEALPDGKISVEDLSADEVALEFQETALLLGSRVTLVGELCRAANGMLSVQPLEPLSKADVKKAGMPAPDDARSLPPSKQAAAVGMAPHALSQAVLVSDDPSLLLLSGDTSDSNSESSGPEPPPLPGLAHGKR